MRAVLTCDDVFDVLTRAPFPSGGTDDEVVESHLAVCHDCRQLAEALRPAVGLFHEAISEDCDDALPTYRGRLTTPPRLPETIDSVCSSPSPTKRASRRSLAVWGSVAAVVVALLFSTLAVIASKSSSSRTLVSSGVALRAQDRDSTLLAALELPNDCRSSAESSLVATSYDCCTKCHAADRNASSSRKAILKSSAACVACHDWITETVAQSISFLFARENERPQIALAKFLRLPVRDQSSQTSPSGPSYIGHLPPDESTTTMAEWPADRGAGYAARKPTWILGPHLSETTSICRSRLKLPPWWNLAGLFGMDAADYQPSISALVSATCCFGSRSSVSTSASFEQDNRRPASALWGFSCC